jgi:hypothetical protein
MDHGPRHRAEACSDEGSCWSRERLESVLPNSGRYAGIQGSYLARQATPELGGKGTAEFRLTLTTREGSHGV